AKSGLPDDGRDGLTRLAKISDLLHPVFGEFALAAELHASVQRVTLTQEVQALFERRPATINSRPFLLKDIVAVPQLLELDVEALPYAADSRVAYSRHLPFPFPWEDQRTAM